MDFDDPAVYERPLSACPLCKSGDIARLHEIGRFSPPFRVDRCESCEFIFMNPRFTERTVRALYSEDYYRGTAEYSYYDEREAERYARYVWDARLRVMGRYARGGNFLDVGAAFGGFMNAASTRYSVYGIEPSEYSGGEAKKRYGERVHIGTLEDHPFESGSFSAITMIEVIEHLADPARALSECFRLLCDGGVLVVQTANMAGRQARSRGERYEYFMPGHLSYFTRKNLTGLLHKSGFSRVDAYLPVEFGLLPKLLKSRHTFKSIADYRSWIRIAWYHLKSSVHFGDFALTSSMVLYAVKHAK